MVNQTVEVNVTNSDVDWFAPFHLVPNELANFIDLVKEHDESPINLDSLVEGDVIAQSTHWRSQFGLEKVNLYRHSGRSKNRIIESKPLGELSLWYADKHGKGQPDFFGWGASQYDVSVIQGDGLIVSPETLDNVGKLVGSIDISQRISRPLDHKLYVENI